MIFLRDFGGVFLWTESRDFDFDLGSAGGQAIHSAFQLDAAGICGEIAGFCGESAGICGEISGFCGEISWLLW